MRTPNWAAGPRLLLSTRQARRRGDAGAVLRAMARGGGDAVSLRLRGRQVMLLLEPRLAGELLAGHAAETVKGPGQQRIRPMLGDGLLTSEGATHQRARRLVAPAFSPGRLAGYCDVFVRCTQDLTATWAGNAQVDVHGEMAALTLRIAGQALLGTDLSAQAPLVRTGLEAAFADFGSAGFGAAGLGEAGANRAGAGGAGVGGAGTRGADTPGVDSGLDGGAGRAARTDDAARASVHALVDDVIARRRAAPAADQGDVLSALLAAAAGPDGLTDQEIHDHVMTLLMAGHETTANALTWTLYLLARHPSVQRRLRDEVSALGGQPPAPDTLASFRYTRAVISEAIRLYPPAWIIGRTLTAEVELAGRRLPAGSVVAVSPLLLHHDPRWYPDPETFDPDRWLDARKQAVPRYAYLPFGTGPRACIGEQFAWAEAVTVLATLAQSWTFQANPAFAAVPSYRVTLRPAGPVPLTLHSHDLMLLSSQKH